jgi:cytochrome c-type biogenesis protein
MVEASLFLFALIGGIVSFISPCNAVLLPTFISYVAAASDSTKKSILMSTLYALGFTFTFAIVGIFFIAIPSLIANRLILQFASGIIMILLAMYLLFQHQILHKKNRIIPPSSDTEINPEKISMDGSGDKQNEITNISNNKKNPNEESALSKYTGYGGAFLLGFSLGSSYIPCVTPIFLTIISIAVVQNSFSSSLYLLIFYGIGITLPFVVIGAMIGKINSRVIVKMVKIGKKIQVLFALILIWFGIEIILTGYGIEAIIPWI